MKKKVLLSLFLICFNFIILGVISVSAESYGVLTYTVSNGEITITDCDSIATEVTIPNEIDERPVKKIKGSTFSGCRNLKSVTITNGVVEIGDMAFINCSNLTSIEIPSSISKIGLSSFVGCTSLEYIHIKDIESWCNIDFSDTSSNPLCNGGKLYLNNILVTALNLSDEAKTVKSNAFYNYIYLTRVSIPSSVTHIGGNAFFNTAWLNSQDDGVVYAGNIAYTYKGKMPTNNKIILKDSTVGIADYAFEGCESLVSIYIPSSVIYIGNCAFYGCTNLKESVLPPKLNSIGASAFTDCDGIINMTIPDSVTEIGTYAFSYCSGLENITLSENLIWIPHGAFYRCENLRNINIPQQATMIGTLAFSGCSSINAINIPKSISTIYEDSFSECRIKQIYIENLESWCKINIERGWNSNSQQVFNGYNLYLNDVLLTNVEIPKDITTIKRYAFSGCTSIETVTLSNSIIDINYGAFSKCTSLKSITMPKSLLNIYNNAFYGSAIEKIYYEGSFEEWQLINIESNNTALTSANISYYLGKPITKTVLSNNKKTFLIEPINTNIGNTIVLVLYKDNTMVNFFLSTYTGNNITFTTKEDYLTAKVMIWKNMKTLVPLNSCEEITITH